MNTNNEKETIDPKTTEEEVITDTGRAPAILEINVHDKVAGKSIGPGQK